MADQQPPLLAALEIPNNKLDLDGYKQQASKAEAALMRLAEDTAAFSNQYENEDDDDTDDLLLMLTAYTDPSAPWSTPSTSRASLSLLSALSPEKTSRFILDTVLERHLRGIFSQTTSKVTSSGRPSRYPEQDARAAEAAARGGMDEPAWKTEGGLTAVSTFAWAVAASEGDLIKANWPLFTPVLLTLLEDRDILIRVKGLEILIGFLAKCPAQVLTNTGIGTVFQDAVFPTILFLPSLTPEVESVKLLRPAYAALLALAKTEEDPRNLVRRQQLDKMMRDGVFAAHHHASEYIGIVEVLMDVTSDIVSTLGIFAAKHLQNILSMISSIMTDPFAAAHGPVILASGKALNTCLRQCWPRMSEDDRAGQIMRIISLCWLNMHSEQTSAKVSKALMADIESELKLTSKMLHVLRQEQGLDPLPEVSQIIQEEPRLRSLFLKTKVPSS